MRTISTARAALVVFVGGFIVAAFVMWQWPWDWGWGRGKRLATVFWVPYSVYFGWLWNQWNGQRSK